MFHADGRIPVEKGYLCPRYPQKSDLSTDEAFLAFWKNGGRKIIRSFAPEKIKTHRNDGKNNRIGKPERRGGENHYDH